MKALIGLLLASALLIAGCVQQTTTTSVTPAPTSTSTPTPTVQPTASATSTPIVSATATPSATPAPTVSTTASPTPAAGMVDVSIQNFAFSPASITISSGTTVRWTNLDSVQHAINLGALGVGPNFGHGQTYTFTFTQAGTITYHCGVHPSMTGTITVNA